MSQTFTRGQKSPISSFTTGDDLYVGIQLNAPGITWDISCFGLDADDKLVDDNYFIFFNQPKSPEGSIQKLGPQSGDTDSFRATLPAVPEKIAKLSFCAAIENSGTASQLQSGYLRIVAGGQEVMRYSFTGADFGTERAIIIGDLYRKGVWRFGAVGQGFAGGLADLIRSYGGNVDDEPAPAAAPAGPAPGFAPPPGGPPPQQGFAPPPAPTQQFAPPPAPTQQFAPPPAPTQQFPPQQQPGYPPQQPGYPPQQPGYPPQQPGYPPQGGQPGYPPQQPGYPQQQPGYPPQGQPGGYPGELLPSQVQPTQPGVMHNLAKYREAPTAGRWTKQNGKLVKVTLGPDAHARRGSMVAYQGNIDFEYKGSGGLKAMFEGAMTGQGLKLMTIKGQGEVFLAENAADLHIVDLQGQALCINANNVLAFDSTLQTEVKRIESPGIPGGGMFHLEVRGQGTVVVMTKGTPVTLQCQGPTFADMNAVVAWTAGMRVAVSTQVRVSRQIYAGASGESVALQFMGMQGHFVVVQPYEV
ncbi:TerD family protein [Dactylosporangium aurantiacum]|uniref:TerD family protein n=1 Tax=Dactylosporangium aurantiacum TaxID=35754 RepID=A0A9Q9IHG7_9ACTN|nr:TerD family protein [Dactylosporangium aurantiacum]MDG6101487.1 TerD family protein [Dactylosporangium aurantiacum]UWZ52665.1 TerD family protein [Dactylosporangium aurantiacum]